MHSRRSILLTCLVLVGIAGCERGPQDQAGPTPEATPPDKATPTGDPPDLGSVDGPTPNIIFIMIDTLRADRLGTYGNPAGLTPEIDAIARESVLFERCRAPAPWTQPSIASLFCGQYPGVHRVTDFVQAVRQTVLGQPKVPVFDERFITLAEWLQARGYATAGVVANPFILREFGFAQGFDHFDASRTGNDVTGGEVNDAACAWLAGRNVDRPFFLYLHYMDVHGPYPLTGAYLEQRLRDLAAQPDKQELTREEFENLGYLAEVNDPPPNFELHRELGRYRGYWVARYDAGVVNADRYVGDLRKRLAEMGLWDDALVIITSDHGEELCERGQWDHGVSVYATELRVPLLVRWAQRLPAGLRVERDVRLIDLPPTLHDLLGLPGDPAAQGASLQPLWTATGAIEPRVAFAEATRHPPEQKAVCLWPWKLIRYYDDGHCELYNLATDPHERNNLAASEPETLVELQNLLDEQLAENLERAEGVSPERTTITPEQLERLRGLGYVDD